MQNLSPNNHLIVYITALSVIGGLMAFVFTGMSAVDGQSKLQNSKSKISMMDRR